jgi:hypothetical protein
MGEKNINQIIKLVVLVIIISYSIDKVIFFALNIISDKVMTGQSIGKINQYFAIKDTTDLLVFGNSRANHHIDVNQFNKNSYNIGIDGTGIAYSSTLISCLPRDKNQVVIIHVDTKDLFDPNYEGSDIKSLKIKFNRVDKITDALKASGQISVLQYFYYSINYNRKIIGIIKNYFRPKYDYKTYAGFDPLTLSKEQEEIRDIVLSKVEETTIDCVNMNVNAVTLKYLKDMNIYCKNTNKICLFVTSPIYKDKCIKDNDSMKEIMLNLGLTYWDFSNLFTNEKDNSLWVDKTHLSEKGAEKFSKHLLEKYNSIY